MKALKPTLQGGAQLVDTEAPVLGTGIEAIVRIVWTSLDACADHRSSRLAGFASGVVTQVNDGDGSLSVGQRVLVVPLGRAADDRAEVRWTCQQEFVAIRTGHHRAVPIPDLIDDDEAVLLSETLPCAQSFADRVAQGTFGDVVIIGAGELGLVASLCLSHRSTARFTLVDRSYKRIAHADALGFDALVLPDKGREDWLGVIFGRRRPTLALVTGQASGDQEWQADVLAFLHARAAQDLVVLSARDLRTVARRRQPEESLSLALALHRRGWRLRAAISHRFALCEAPSAIEECRAGRADWRAALLNF